MKGNDGNGGCHLFSFTEGRKMKGNDGNGGCHLFSFCRRGSSIWRYNINLWSKRAGGGEDARGVHVKIAAALND